MKLNSDEKMMKQSSEATQLIKEITLKSNSTQELPQKCNNLTKFIFSHPYLLHSDLNEYFESSGILGLLITFLNKLHEQPKRDILRLVHMLLQVRRSLRDEARSSELLQTFLQKNLELSDCWENWNKYKHHINIASLLLVDGETKICSFNNDTVRKLVRKTIDDIVNKNLQRNKDVMPCVIFYACSMLPGKFENVPIVPEDEIISGKVLVKEVIGDYLDILRNYIDDFKLFYTPDAEGRAQYLLYKPASGYSFHQVCNSIVYYSVQNIDVRTNIHYSGIYIMMNSFCSLMYLPESLLQCGIEILKLLLIDKIKLNSVKNEFLKPLNEKLNVFLRNDSFTENTKATIRELLRSYEASDIDNIACKDVIQICPVDDDPSLIHLTGINGNQADQYTFFSYEKWGHLDVDEWLADNNLDDLREKFSIMTGRGLKQLKMMFQENNKMQTIDFIMNKTGGSFQMTLELMGAIEML